MQQQSPLQVYEAAKSKLDPDWESELAQRVAAFDAEETFVTACAVRDMVLYAEEAAKDVAAPRQLRSVLWGTAARMAAGYDDQQGVVQFRECGRDFESIVRARC